MLKYLRCVVMLLKEQKKAEVLKKRLKEEGAVLDCFVLPLPKGADVGLFARMVEDRLSQSFAGCTKPGILWITDSGKAAEELLKEGQAVMVYLHEGNQAESFLEVQYACQEPDELEPEYLERVYCRYAGIPWKILETERLLLRETIVEDVDDFYALYSEPEVTKYIEKLFENREEEIAYIRNYIKMIYGFYGFGIWTVIEKESGNVIGRAGLNYREGFEEPELGFVIGRAYQKRGYGREICRAILRYGFEELELSVIQAFVMRENITSACLCRRLGMKYMAEEELEGTVYQRFRLSYTEWKK